MESHPVTFYFSHPTTILISGPTRSGKTFFVYRLLKHSLIQPFPSRIIWFFKESQPLHRQIKSLIPHTEFIRNLNENVIDSLSIADRNLIIIDDLMNSATDSKQIAELFTQESHHRNLTVILIVQNLFHHGRSMRTISLNAHYLVLYKNPRDSSQIRFLAQQIYPENSSFLVNVFKHATEQSHSYLILDLHPDTAEEFRILTNIFPSEQIRIYQQWRV